MIPRAPAMIECQTAARIWGPVIVGDCGGASLNGWLTSTNAQIGLRTPSRASSRRIRSTTTP